ncbi:MAG: HAD family hydrolase [bacterium]
MVPQSREELADDPTQARYLLGTEIEIVNPNLELGKIKHFLFDNDGTISTIREGWEEIMRPVMVEMIVGDHANTIPQEKRAEIEQRVAQYVDETTGVQTILQMEGLRKLVIEYGLVEKEKILDAFGYKKEYLRRLMIPVRQRIAKLERGELDSSDLMIKGSLYFVKMLYDHGITLYLASGTDLADVINEATKLTVAEYFSSNIYGALGTVKDYSKGQVIKRIITENNLRGPEFGCAGDGPVEIEETKKVKGIAICVASDEKRRWGLNPKKRRRGILKGADIVVPDFSQTQALFELLTSDKRLIFSLTDHAYVLSDDFLL